MRRNTQGQKKRDERYHHGDLKKALIRATDEILTEQGLGGFSLREAARRAGVSQAAPAHHFGSAAGLLSEVAMLGYIQLAQHLEIDALEATPSQRLRLQGVGYVRFALTYPGRFHLMFRRDLLGDEHAGLREAGEQALQRFEETIRAIRSIPAGMPLDSEARTMLLASWSMVHGFAYLVLDGKLAYMHPGTPLEDLLGNVLPEMLLSQWPDP